MVSINNRIVVKSTVLHREAFVREYVAHGAKRSLDLGNLNRLGNSSP